MSAASIGGCSVTERLARDVLSLPMYAELTEEQIDRVAEVVHTFDAAGRRWSCRSGSGAAWWRGVAWRGVAGLMPHHVLYVFGYEGARSSQCQIYCERSHASPESR